MNPKPKPTRSTRSRIKVKAVVKSAKRKKGHWHGICPMCGEISHSKQEIKHDFYCTGEIPLIAVKKNQTDRQLLCMALDELCRRITTWRDGCNCVLGETDGGRCSNDSTWGHVIPQGSNSYLIYNLSNSFRQCSTHNGIHRFVQLTYHLWYQMKFGKLALAILEKEKNDHPRSNFSVADYREILVELSMMYQNRYAYSTATMTEKVAAGFYGSVIRDAWIKEGKV